MLALLPPLCKAFTEGLLVECSAPEIISYKHNYEICHIDQIRNGLVHTEVKSKSAHGLLSILISSCEEATIQQSAHFTSNHSGRKKFFSKALASEKSIN